jgi:HTH-type transcriptional regulator / antitoxin HigA
MIQKLIKTQEEYDKAIARIEEILQAEPGTPEGDELELLSLLIEKYDEGHDLLPDPSPVEVIQFYIEQRGLKAKDLVGIIGDKTTVSKVLNNERKLNLGMIRRLHKQANIPYHLLMEEY